MKPIFSVVTVHFNQLALLKSTVENIISQEGFGDIIEYIIVDGMSTDGTIDYLHQFNFTKSIKKLVERDSGIYDAMNKAIKMASGKYVIFINAGDQLQDKKTLSAIYNSDPQFEILYGDTSINYPTFSRIAKAKPLTDFWKSLPFVHQSVIVRRELLAQNPFNINYKFCADYNQLATLFVAKYNFTYSNKVISQIQAGGTSDRARVKATKEVFEISKHLFKLNLVRKIFFTIKIFKSRFAILLKAFLPQKAVNKVTKLKY